MWLRSTSFCKDYGRPVGQGYSGWYRRKRHQLFHKWYKLQFSCWTKVMLRIIMYLWTSASIDGLVNGTVDTALNYTWRLFGCNSKIEFLSLIETYETIRSSIFNSTYNKNGTEGAVVETIINLLKSDTVTIIMENITMVTIINPMVEFYHHDMNCFYGDITSLGDISTKPQPKFTFRNAAKFKKTGAMCQLQNHDNNSAF